MGAMQNVKATRPRGQTGRSVAHFIAVILAPVVLVLWYSSEDHGADSAFVGHYEFAAPACPLGRVGVRARRRLAQAGASRGAKGRPGSGGDIGEGSHVKVLAGKFKGLTAVVTEGPNHLGCVHIRLDSTGKVIGDVQSVLCRRLEAPKVPVQAHEVVEAAPLPATLLSPLLKPRRVEEGAPAAPATAKVGRVHHRRSSHQKWDFLKDFEKNMANEGIEQAVSTDGADEVALAKLMERFRSGAMDFVDFVNAVSYLNDLGGDGGMVDELARQSSLLQARGMTEKIMEYRRVVFQGMTSEERAAPGLFFVQGAASRKRVEDLAARLGMQVEAVDQFLLEFKTMCVILSDLGSGKSMDQMTRDLALERAEEQVQRKSRNMRRRVHRSVRGKSGAEWANL